MFDQTSYNADLKKWADENRAKVSQVVDNQQTPVEEQTVVPESTDLPDKQVAQVEVKEPEKEVEAEKVELLSWDADTTEVTKTESPKFDFSQLSSALELGEIKDDKELVTKVSALKKQVKTLSEKPLEGIPEEFKEVIEVAKTGDWKEYLSNQLVDFTKLDPYSEFENDFYQKHKQNPKFFDEKGQWNDDLFQAALDSIPEAVQEVVGRQILDAKAQLQTRQKIELKQKAETRRAEAEKTLTQAALNLSELLPLESHGIKFESKHSTQLQQGIASSVLTKKHLGGLDFDTLVRSGADMTSIAKTVAMAEWGQQMIKFKASAIEAQTKKTILSKTQNVQLETPGSIVQPEEVSKKPLTAAEKLTQYVSKQSSPFG